MPQKLFRLNSGQISRVDTAQWLADENIPRLLVASLRHGGEQVSWILEDHRGLHDPGVLQQARSECRILLTADLDFGNLIFRQGLQPAAGVVLIRYRVRSPEELVKRVLPVLVKNTEQWLGRFSVIGAKRIRSIPLPGYS